MIVIGLPCFFPTPIPGKPPFRRLMWDTLAMDATRDRRIPLANSHLKPTGKSGRNLITSNECAFIFCPNDCELNRSPFGSVSIQWIPASHQKIVSIALPALMIFFSLIGCFPLFGTKLFGNQLIAEPNSHQEEPNGPINPVTQRQELLECCRITLYVAVYRPKSVYEARILNASQQILPSPDGRRLLMTPS
jgi:hypothetical protein